MAQQTSCPQFCVSIGLCVGGRPVLAAVRDPMRQETFTARQGHGFYLNGSRVSSSVVQHLTGAMMAVEWPRSGLQREAKGVPRSATARQLRLLQYLLQAPHSLSSLRRGVVRPRYGMDRLWKNRPYFSRAHWMRMLGCMRGGFAYRGRRRWNV